MLARVRALSGPAALLLTVICFFWKLTFTSQFNWLESPDLANQVVPWFQYEAHQLRHSTIPIWDPFHFGGQSLIAQGQPGLAYPPNWLLFLMPFRAGHIDFGVLNWYFVFIHLFAALFCYLLCRDLGRSAVASVLGGIAFALGGYVGTTNWPQMLNGAIWGPLVFLFLFRVANKVRPMASAAFSGLFLGVSWLGGHHQIPIFLSLAAGGVWLYFLFEHGRTQAFRFAPLAVFLAFFLCSGALQMWPSLAYGRTAVRWVGSQHDPIPWNEPVPYIVHQQYSLKPIYLLGFVIPGYADGSNPYVGVVALTLAGLALACWWKTKEIRILFGIGIAGLLFALGGNDVFQGILYAVVPFVEKARSPSAALYLFHFVIAVLVAFGLDAIFLASVKPLLRRITMILLCFGAMIFSITFAILLAKTLAWPGDDRVMISMFASLALAGLVYRAHSSPGVRNGILVLMIGLYVIELGNVTLYSLPHKDEVNRNIFLKNYPATRQVAEFLRHQPAPVRVWVNDDDVPFNFGDWYEIDTMDGYVAGVPFNVNQLELHTPRSRMLYGAAYTVSKKPLFQGQQEVFRDDNGLCVFKSSTNVFPRVWTVHEAIHVNDPADARRHLQDSSFDLQKKTFVYAVPPSLEQCDGDVVRTFARRINDASTVVDMKCRGMVVLGENNAPGWVATVDGKQAKMYDAYTSLRGIVVGPGTHTIETRYRPLSVISGAIATLASFLAALALFAWHDRW